MIPSTFRIKNTVLLMALAAVYPLYGHAAAGVAQFATGDVTLRRGTGTDPLTKGKDIESGDAIVTGPTGRAQVRFSDGGLVALQPNSQFNITKYADANDPKQDSFLVDLLRGGMRSITGLIGKRNHANFKVTTTTATIGIRGSAFNLAYAPDGSLVVATEMDEIEVCTQAGCIGLTAGESARVTDPNRLAERTNARVSVFTPPPRQTPEVSGNQVTPAGLPSIVTVGGTPLPPPPAPGQPPAPPVPAPPPAGPQVLSGISFAYSGGYVSGTPAPATVQAGAAVAAPAVSNYAEGDKFANGALVIDGAGKPSQYTSSSNVTVAPTGGGSTTVNYQSGSMASNDYMVLGSWSQGAVSNPNAPSAATTDNYAPLNFVAGLPTSNESLAINAGMTGTFNLKGATPVFLTGGLPNGSLLDSSKLEVKFMGRASAMLDVFLDLALPGGGYTVELRGSLSTSNAQFAGSLDCNGACGGYVQGFFGGNQASKAGLSYTGCSYDLDAYFGGAAVFERGPLSPIPTESFLSFVTAATANTARPFFVGGYGGSSNFQGNLLTDSTYSYGSFVRSDASAQITGDGVGDKTGTDPDFIGWGYWTSGTRYAGNLQDVHYIVGKPTSDMPSRGTASYTVIGATTPTASGGAKGTFDSATITANFLTPSIDATVKNTFNGTQYTYTVNGMTITDAKFQGSSGTTFMNGILVGPQASRLGLVYQGSGGTLGTVSGALAAARGAIIGGSSY